MNRGLIFLSSFAFSHQGRRLGFQVPFISRGSPYRHHCCAHYHRIHPDSTRKFGTLPSTPKKKISKMGNLDWNLLAQSWYKDLSSAKNHPTKAVTSAVRRSLPLLEDPTAVPFVCRYREDLIHPLSTSDVHQLAEILQKYKSLESLRKRILEKMPVDVHEHIKHRVQTSVSKSELEDLYAPFKPPSKGSLEDRIRQDYPDLIPHVDSFWEDCTKAEVSCLKPRDAVITLLGNKIASHVPTSDALMEHVERYTRIQVSKLPSKKNTSTSSRKASTSSDSSAEKFFTYYDFSSSFSGIRNHQVLAINRGLSQKVLRLSFDIDGERAESTIRRSLIDSNVKTKNYHYNLWKDATHDAWTRLLRKRMTTRLWKAKCDQAEEQSIHIFCENLIKALLMPPLEHQRPVLALDPGFQAGIKCALLDKYGQLLMESNDPEKSLVNVKFLGPNRDRAIEKLGEALRDVSAAQESAKNKDKEKKVIVALGNGHGSQEARELIDEASRISGFPIDIHLVNEAGASVWSVTEGASREFPSQQPAAIAAVSIGRRLQNPLPELVKIPPKSLGLGMYQHDLSEKNLDTKLHTTSVNAVAEVGVEVNSCSIEILEKIPGLTTTLCKRIIESRPIYSRRDLLKCVTGMGPKTFENCAAFIRIEEGKEPLDRTLVHPESYDLAKHLLQRLDWNLDDKDSIGAHVLNTREQRVDRWKAVIEEASIKYDVSPDRVASVIDHLIQSITNPDVRLGGSLSIINSSSSGSSKSSCVNAGNADSCSSLPSDLSHSVEALRHACPVRGIKATVRNVVDFGAFIDFGFENDGLLHVSKLGRSLSLDSLLVGMNIGVDILSASSTGRVSLALNGLNFDPDDERPFSEPKKSTQKKTSGAKRSYSTTPRPKKRKKY